MDLLDRDFELEDGGEKQLLVSEEETRQAEKETQRAEKETRRMEKEASKEQNIRIRLDRAEDDTHEIDLLNVASHMGKRKKVYAWLLATAIFAGSFAGFLSVAAEHLSGKGSYARAMLSFHYEGIEDGLDPNGVTLDVNKLKAPSVIKEALTTLGMGEDDALTERLRESISIEGVIPQDAVERITVINRMAEQNATNYEKLLDISYFPSQYIVYLYDNGSVKKSLLAETLNAIIESYRQYFLNTYANNEALTVTLSLNEGKTYDYGESIDMLRTQIRLMLDYVGEKRREAPDFRAAATGLSFGDIEASVQFIRDVDLVKLSSFVEQNALTRDRARQEEYYRYRIKEYNMRLSELQVQLNNVTQTIENYEKDPIVIVSAQETTQEVTQSSQYYDTLIMKKLQISDSIAQTNTELNEAYTLLNSLVSTETSSAESDFAYADALLADMNDSVREWVTLTEETTEEYYATTLFSDAVRITVPAKYYADGGLVHMAKRMLLCIGALCGIVLLIWCADGFRIELLTEKEKNGKESVRG